MNFERIKFEFLSYLQEKLGKDTNIEKEEYNFDSDISLFMYSQEFKDYLVEEMGADVSIFSKSISEIMSMDFENEPFVVDDNAENSIFSGRFNDISSDAAIDSTYMDSDIILKSDELESFLSNADSNNGNSIDSDPLRSNNTSIEDSSGTQTQNYNLDFLNKIASENGKNIFNETESNIIGRLFDKDNDGKLSKEEQEYSKQLLSYTDGNNENLSKEDLTLLKNYIVQMTDNGMLSDEIIAQIKGLDGNSAELSQDDFKVLSNLLLSDAQSAQEGIQPNSVMESSGAGASSGTSSSSGTGKTVSSPANKEKDISNLSIDELEEELKTADANVKQTQNSYMEKLEEINTELAKNIKDTNSKIEETQGSLDTANIQLSEHTSALEQDSRSLQNAEARIGEIDGSLASLKSKLNSDNSDIDKAAVKAQIDELESEKETIENETIPALNESIQEHQDAIDELENITIPDLESKLTQYNEDAAKYQQELNNLSNSNGELKTQLDAYNSAVNYQNTVKQMLELRKTNREKEENSNRPDKSQAPEDYRNEDEYNLTNLPMSYTLDGKEYHCVGFEGYDLDGDGEIDFKPDSWEEVQRYFLNGGVANIGKYGSMQCHNYSDELGQFVLGDANIEFVQALYDETNNPEYGNIDKAGLLAKQKEWNPRRFAQCKAADRDAERAIIENELQNGRPCLVSVPYTGGQHWVTAVGISDAGDILIWDSYNSSMEKLGCSSNSDTEKLHRNMATGNGVMVYCQNYSYQYSTAKCFDYWSYVGNSPQYVLENAYK